VIFEKNISQGSVATQLSFGGMFNSRFISNLSQSVTLYEFLKSVNIWQNIDKS